MTRLTALPLKCLFPLLLCCCGALSHVPAALALDPRMALNQYLMDVWTTENGLPQNSVQAILQTRDGYLWLGTQEGLVRFDGVRFTIFNNANTPGLKDQDIRALCEDDGGNLWIGTDYGHLLRYKNGEFTSVHLFQGSIYTLIKDRAGSLWMGAGREGLARFQNGQLTTWSTQQGLLHHVVTSIYEDKAGRLWVGTEVGLSEFREGNFTHYTTQQGLAPGRVRALTEDQDGTLWIGTVIGGSKQGGLTEFRNGQFKVWTTRAGFPGSAVRKLLTDNADSLWLGTESGLYRLRDYQLTGLSRDHLPDDQIRALYEDREGSLWLGTLSSGLIRLRDNRFTNYRKSDGLTSDDVTAIRSGRDGSVWVGTSDGLNHIKEGRITHFTRQTGLLDNYINDIFEDMAGNVWLATDGGVSRRQNGRLQSWTTRDGLSTNSVGTLSQDQSGTLYFGTTIGLDRYKDGKISSYLKTEVPLFRWSFLLARRNGELVAGDDRGGGLAFVRDGKLTNYPHQEGYPDLIAQLYEDQDSCLWISTYNNGGLFCLKDGRFKRITVKDGLSNTSIISILEDQQGNLWFGSSSGIFRVARQELHDFVDGKIVSVHSISYDTTDGMKSRECNGGAARTSDGRLWFATVKGVAIIDPANLHPNTVPPPVVIESATVDGVQYPGHLAARFAAGSHSFEFHYTGLSLLVPQKVRFKYKLENYDKDWVDAETRRTAYYTNLPPGDYKFRVIAANNDGLWNEAGAAFDFYQNPHFWQTWWFYSLCVLTLAGAVYGGVKLRVRQMQLREEQLVVLVKERTRNLVKAKEDTEAALKEVERQKAIIEADNERKTRELEEARALQLSLLPRQLPQLPHLEIAAWMRPATEVGGDYYDFHLNGDGSLVAAVGDATGHGLKAGTMVTATKLLFETLADEQDLRVVLRQANQSLRKMKLRGLYMAFALARINENGLTVCGAGMPPLLIYRANAERVESVPLKGMPLGSVSKFNYVQQEFSLAPGDVLLLMTDGFAERFNCEGEMLGEEKASEVLAAAARLPAPEIIARLVSIGDEWAGEQQQDDDVTFVVMKVIVPCASNSSA